ncbi:hypothetical protein [Paenibacillus sp. Marseille-Q4541]|uniref:hypothetical protein n=1 Tax=Paenibacillus sp. Marseille-Q4541 TaxID=2831522 RepID=UPI001BAC0AE2|nr:hypothetical protein [Paenibacillus sp. Marseille-Q4541]
MKLTKLGLTILCMSMFCLFSSFAPSFAEQRSEVAAVSAPDQVTQLAERTVKELSKDSEFALFNHSTLNIMPLGPGTHSYLVHVLQGENIVGYVMITAEQLQNEVKATQDITYLVTEYGVGSASVFDPELLSLHGHLPQGEKGTIDSASYQMKSTGILSYWVIQIAGNSTYVDAGNGDVLLGNPEELDEPPASETFAARIGGEHRLSNIQKTSLPFDPSENLQWLVTTPVAITSESLLLQQLDSSKQLIFSSPGNNMWYSGPLAISGYATWTSPDMKNLHFVRIGTHPSQIRYIPAERLLGKGHFYESSK